MTQEEFIKVLDEKRYSYEIEGDKIIVTDRMTVELDHIRSLPPGVVFKCKWNVRSKSITSLPPDVEFENDGNVILDSLTSISPGVEFNYGGEVDLRSLTSLPPGVVFKNEGVVDLRSLIGGQFNYWNGNIEGISSNMLLNVMIKQVVFER